MIEHRLQRRRKMLLPQTRRHPQQHRLMEALDRRALLQQPVHDRRRREAAGRNIGGGADRLAPAARNTRQRRTVWCWNTSRAVTASPSRRARLTNWIDMMLSPPSSKKLSSIPTASTPSTSANRPHRISSCGVPRTTPRRHPDSLRRRQRTAVKLAVRRQRKRIQHHDRRRHQILRQTTRQRSPKRTTVQTRTRARTGTRAEPTT